MLGNFLVYQLLVQDLHQLIHYDKNTVMTNLYLLLLIFK